WPVIPLDRLRRWGLPLSSTSLAEIETVYVPFGIPVGVPDRVPDGIGDGEGFAPEVPEVQAASARASASASAPANAMSIRAGLTGPSSRTRTPEQPRKA